jgi:hypothetical protein
MSRIEPGTSRRGPARALVAAIAVLLIAVAGVIAARRYRAHDSGAADGRAAVQAQLTATVVQAKSKSEVQATATVVAERQAIYVAYLGQREQAAQEVDQATGDAAAAATALAQVTATAQAQAGATAVTAMGQASATAAAQAGLAPLSARSHT